MADRVRERRRVRRGNLTDFYAARDLLSARNTQSLLQSPVKVGVFLGVGMSCTESLVPLA